MAKKLVAGQELVSRKGSIVKVVKIGKDCFYVTYKTKGYKCPYSLLGNKLFHPSEYYNSKKDATLPAVAPVKKSCDNCMSMRSGDCFGNASRLCDYYRPAPTIAKEEMDSWKASEWGRSEIGYGPLE